MLILNPCFAKLRKWNIWVCIYIFHVQTRLPCNNVFFHSFIWIPMTLFLRILESVVGHELITIPYFLELLFRTVWLDRSKGGVNSFGPERCGRNYFKFVIFEHMLRIMFAGTSGEIYLSWIPPFDDLSAWWRNGMDTLAPLLAFCKDNSISHRWISLTESHWYGVLSSCLGILLNKPSSSLPVI